MPKGAPLQFFTALFLCVMFAGGCGTSRKEIVPLGQTGLSAKEEKERREIEAMTRQIQADMESRRVFYEEEELTAYLHEVARPFLDGLNLKEEEKANFKIRVLRDPTVNASALITGDIHFNSGILSRLQNEDQLAFVLGHEISHVYHQDVLYYTLNLQRKTVGFKIMDLLLAPPAAFVGASGLSDLALGLFYAASIQGYGRSEEAFADKFALEQMTKTGHDPAASISFFDILLAEKTRYKRGIEIFFLSSHPSNTARKQQASEWLKSNPAKIKIEEGLEKTPSDRFQALTAGVRLQDVKLNLDFRRYFHALELVEKIRGIKKDETMLYFYEGEIYRRLPEERDKIKEELSDKEWEKIKKVEKEKQDKEWRDKAFEAYQKALVLDVAHAETYKGLGEWYLQEQKLTEAAGHFNKYLELKPEAVDRRSVLRHLRDIEELTQKEAVT